MLREVGWEVCPPGVRWADVEDSHEHVSAGRGWTAFACEGPSGRVMAIRRWSSTQSSVSTSSGEAEDFALGRGRQRRPGLATAMRDLGWELKR